MKLNLLKRGAAALALLVLITPIAANAAVNRAVVAGMTEGSGSSIGTFSVDAHFLDGSSDTGAYFVDLPIGAATTTQGLLDSANNAIQNYATSQGYSLSGGVTWPYLSPTEVSTLITSSTASLATVARTGSYSDLTNKPATGTTTYAYPTRSLNTAYQISTTNAELVSYTVDIGTSLSLSGGTTGTVTLQYADDSGFTTNVKTVQSSVNGNTGTLTVGLALAQTATASLNGVIPAGKYVKLVTANTTGTPTFTFRAAQEVGLPF